MIRTVLGATLLVVASTQAAVAGPSLYGTAGTLGLGIGSAAAVTNNLDIRGEYTAGSLSRTISDTDIDYDGKYKLSNTSLLLDWYPSASGVFRISAGGVYSRNKVTVRGKPTNSTYEFNGVTYTAPAGATVDGEVKLADGLVPYLGIGWSTRASAAKGFVFRGDVGVIYQKPKATLSASGIPGLNPADVEAERQKLQDDVGKYKFYPVLSISMGYAF